MMEVFSFSDQRCKYSALEYYILIEIVCPQPTGMTSAEIESGKENCERSMNGEESGVEIHQGYCPEEQEMVCPCVDDSCE